MIKQFHYKEFLPLERIVHLKQKQNISVSVVIPASNEARTIGNIITRTKDELFDNVRLIDEIIVIDGNSTDGTRECALDAGAAVFSLDEIGPPGVVWVNGGKGVALWKSLYVTTGDIIVCIDADIVRYDARFVYGLVAPLLMDQTLSFIKGFYKRPIIINDVAVNNYGGRVTEILVRPLLAAFYPDLAWLFQPLAGEYSFRRCLIQQIPFYSGYGVEIGLILDIFKKFGISVFGQVDMDIRCHRNRNVKELGLMSFGILHAIIKKLEEDQKVSVHEPLCSTMIFPAPSGAEKINVSEQVLPPLHMVGKQW